ncbi:retrovirus-related pol polyprotein from transposon TNT 1-94 [Tanacetum coccineum]
MVTDRSLLAVAAMQGWDITQMDVSNAFLHGDLFKDVYMHLFMGYVSKGENVQDSKLSSSKVCKLRKSLYGLKKAPRQWFAKLSNALLSFGYKQYKADYSLFTKTNAEGFIVVLVYVDDLMITSSDSTQIELLKSQLRSQFHMKDLGALPYKLPMDPNLKLQADVGTPLQDPKLVYAESNFSSYASCETLMRYLLNSPSQGILLSHHSKVQLTAYCDSDWASFPMTRRSTTSYCILLGDSPISYKSKKEGVVSRSSVEAEYRAMAITCCEITWLTTLLKYLGLKYLHPVTLHCDNQAAIHIAANLVFHAKTKHIEMGCLDTTPASSKGVVVFGFVLYSIYVLCVPTFKFSLLSVPKLTKENNYVAIFFPNFCVNQDLRRRKVEGLGRKIRGLYHLLIVPIDKVDAKLRMEVENTFLKFVELQFSTKVKCIRSDNTLDFIEGPCALYLASQGIQHQTTYVDRPQQNGRGDCITKATYLINKTPSSILNNKIPYEKLLKKVLDYSNLRVFGCFAVATNPSRVVDKFSPRGVPCVFIGYPAHQKGYKLYNLLTHVSFVSRDVVFHEHIFHFAESSSQNFFQPLPVSVHPSVYDYSKPANTQNGPTAQEETIVPNTTEEPVSVVPNTPEVSSSNVPTSSTTTNTEAPLIKSSRSSKPPSWTKEFVVPILKPSANKVTTPTLSSQFFCFPSTLVTQQDPKGFKEVVKDPVWCEAMNAELRTLEENG